MLGVMAKKWILSGTGHFGCRPHSCAPTIRIECPLAVCLETIDFVFLLHSGHTIRDSHLELISYSYKRYNDTHRLTWNCNFYFHGFSLIRHLFIILSVNNTSTCQLSQTCRDTMFKPDHPSSCFIFVAKAKPWTKQCCCQCSSWAADGRRLSPQFAL